MLIWRLCFVSLLSYAADHFPTLLAIVCLQPQYNLLCRAPEWDILQVCKNEKVAVIPWSPLAGGWLSGRYVRDQPPTDGNVLQFYSSVDGILSSLAALCIDFLLYIKEESLGLKRQSGRQLPGLSWTMNTLGESSMR